MDKSQTVSSELTPLIAEWSREHGGIAISESAHLSDPGFSLMPPVLTADGSDTTKPHCKVANSPARIIKKENLL
jgi:hypothetical protein